MNKSSVILGMRYRVLFLLAAILLAGALVTAWIMPAVQAQAQSAPDLQDLQSEGSQAEIAAERNEPPEAIQSATFQTNTISSVTAPEVSTFDLEIKKSQLPQPFSVGGDNRYIINVTRVITGAINQAVVISDNLPTGMSWTPPTSGNWNCVNNTTRVSCYYAISNPPTFDPLEVKVALDPSKVNEKSINTAELIIDDAQITSTNRSTVTTMVNSIDLQLIKTYGPTVVPNVGTTIQYTLTVKNNGPVTAPNVVVTDSISSKISTTIPIWNSSVGTIISDNGLYTWTIFSLPKGSQETLLINAKLKSEANGEVITNTAVASVVNPTNNPDWNKTNNTASTSFVVGGLEISKIIQGGKTSAYVGEKIDYVILIRNISVKNIGDVFVTDVFTNILDIDSCTAVFKEPAGTGSCYVSNRILNYNISNLASQQSISITVSARGNNSILTPTDVENKARVTWKTLVLDTEKVKIKIFPAGALSVSKDDGLSTVQAGQNVTYTIKIKNIGNRDTVAGTLQFSDYSSNFVNYLRINKNGLDMVERTINGIIRTWDFPTEVLNPGEEIKFYIGAQIDISAGLSDRAINEVTATAEDLSTQKLNAYGSDENIVTNPPDISLEKFVSPSTAYVGRDLTYAITIRNNSTISRTLVIVRDVMPTSLDFVSSTQGVYNSANRTLTFNIGTMLANSVQTFYFTARGNSTITSQRTIYNTATATWGTSGQSSTSNQAGVYLIPSGAIEVKNSNGTDFLVPGQTTLYTITLTNIGSLAIRENTIAVTDTFLSYLVFDSLWKEGVDMTEVAAGTNYRKWTIKKGLNPGEKVSFKVEALVPSDAPLGGNVINRVFASAKDTDDNKLDPYAVDDIDPLKTAPIEAVRVIKDVDPILAKVGENVNFRLRIENGGTETIYNLRLTDIFPAELDMSSATTNRGTATLNTGTRTLEVTIPSLGIDESATILVTSKVNSSVTTAKVIRNIASLTALPIGTIGSNAVRFRVLPSSALPGTGDLQPADWTPAEPAARQKPGLALILGLIAGAGLALTGLISLCLGFYARSHRPLRAASYMRLGGVLILAAFLVSAAGCTVDQLANKQPQLAIVTGQKPQHATPISHLPTPTLALGASLPSGLPTPTVDPNLFQLTATPAILPDYPVPAPTEIPMQGPEGIPPDSSNVNRIVIPVLGLDTVVKFVPFSDGTWLIAGLKQEVAWMGDTSWPGLGGNTGFAGHVDLVTGEKGPFWNLKDLKAGDEVTLHTDNNLFKYVVREQQVVDDWDMSVIEPTEKPQITLITCTGWDSEMRLYLKRLIVYADLLGVQPLVSQSD